MDIKLTEADRKAARARREAAAKEKATDQLDELEDLAEAIVTKDQDNPRMKAAILVLRGEPVAAINALSDEDKAKITEALVRSNDQTPKAPGVLGDGSTNPDDKSVKYGPGVRFHKGRVILPIYKNGHPTNDPIDEDNALRSQFSPYFDPDHPDTLLGYYNPLDNGGNADKESGVKKSHVLTDWFLVKKKD